MKSNAFDLVTTNEVLEHVPDIDAALAEIVRVLKPGGWHIGTHPFAFMKEKGMVRAEWLDCLVVSRAGFVRPELVEKAVASVISARCLLFPLATDTGNFPGPELT